MHSNEQEHLRHRPYRSARWFRSLANTLHALGVISGTRSIHGAWCSGCMELYWRGKRSYILGASREAWRCLLVGHHRRGDPIGFGLCAKCIPCPDCGSKQEGHPEGCPMYAGVGLRG